ncbi:DUF3310 domain-containing protein [Vagococcus carniphilus]|nr:DUF3310 domain-containing protein [Vagococcus carniphilus]MDT2840740.1 DUF3310 domain-containing protein [Vagococcus carniphilus]
MQIYHVETQEDYDALMVELEKEGFLWVSGKLPTSKINRWGVNQQNSCIVVRDTISYASKIWCRYNCSGIPIQKYKAEKEIHDPVNSPNHYAQGELEVIDILEDKLTPDEFMGFLKGNVTKYNFRETHKNQDEDIAKAEWYQLKLKEFVAEGKSIYSRVAKKFTKLTGYEFDDELISKLESGELRIVERDKED